MISVFLVDIQQTSFFLRKASLNLHSQTTQHVSSSLGQLSIHILSAHTKAISYFNLLSLKVYNMEMSCSTNWRTTLSIIFPSRLFCLMLSQFFSHLSLLYQMQTSCLLLLFPHPLSILHPLLQFSRVFPSLYVHATQQAQPQREAHKFCLCLLYIFITWRNKLSCYLHYYIIS